MSYAEPRPTAVFDTEAYVNYWSIAFQDVDTGAITLFEKWNDSDLDMKGIARMFKRYRVVGFNSNNYDMCVIALAMTGASNGELKQASDTIIMSDMKPWQFYEHYNVSLPGWIDHIDLMEVSPGSPQRPSLKLYGGRLHYKTMMDLPYSPDDRITEEKRETMVRYLGNDLGLTRAKYFELKPQIDLRSEISDIYGTDVRSKSDAQVAESLLKKQLELKLKRRLYKPDVRAFSFKYEKPTYVKFKTPALQQMLDIVCGATVFVKPDGQVTMPEALSDVAVTMGVSTYRIGIGGLHSSENKTSHFSDESFELIDQDAASFYPNLILNNSWFPPQIGLGFLDLYRSIVEQRIGAKNKSSLIKKQIRELEKELKEVLNA
jgi:hypothetical protein